MTVVHCQFLWSWSSSWLCKFPLTLQIIHRYSVHALHRAPFIATGKSSCLYYTEKQWLIIATAAQDTWIHSVYVTAGGADTAFILRWPSPSSVLRKMCNVVHNYMVTPNFTDDQLGKNCWSLGKYGSCHEAWKG